jgi:acyl-CoA thioesterase-1
MQNPKSKQLILKLYKSDRNILLKFCYLLLILCIISCGSDTYKKDKATKKDTATPQNTIEKKNESKTVLFFGTSLTAGLGLDDVNDAYPGLIQKKLDSFSMNYTVINSGLSGETTAAGINRIDWVLNQKVDVFVLELGANDGLRGISLKETKANLQGIIDAVLKKNADTKILIAGMQMPPNMGEDYTSEFREIFPELAEINKLPLVPFLLKDVGGIPELNQADGIHPTAEGQKIIAETVCDVLQTVLVNE